MSIVVTEHVLVINIFSFISNLIREILEHMIFRRFKTRVILTFFTWQI